jgi:four helix bundle protein
MSGYRELIVWQEAKAIAVEIYRLTENLRDFSLRDQMRRAAVSIASNIAEGDERGSPKEGIHFLYIAKGSTAELRTQMEIAFEVGILNRDSLNQIIPKAEQLSQRLGSLINHRKNANAAK